MIALGAEVVSLSAPPPSPLPPVDAADDDDGVSLAALCAAAESELDCSFWMRDAMLVCQSRAIKRHQEPSRARKSQKEP